eukprot:TRINITY_DN40327_c0_g1_i1.p1 TRINITY_DN40327_c0_g1~~TRINITY_DN40327_c0_g1_i1.p1  ORF type:complete len:158 (+),score=7.09 TRINITY_DN40327_c0_g1_i1:25-498(+)
MSKQNIIPSIKFEDCSIEKANQKPEIRGRGQFTLKRQTTGRVSSGFGWEAKNNSAGIKRDIQRPWPIVCATLKPPHGPTDQKGESVRLANPGLSSCTSHLHHSTSAKLVPASSHPIRTQSISSPILYSNYISAPPSPCSHSLKAPFCPPSRPPTFPN